MSKVTRIGFSGGPSKDALDIFKERFHQVRDYNQSSQPNVSVGNPYEDRATLSRARSSKELYAQELKDQIREQMVRKQSRDEHLKREEQQLLQQNIDNYPFGRSGLQAYNTRRKPLTSQQDAVSSGQLISPYPINNYQNDFDRQKNDFPNPYKKLTNQAQGWKPPLPIENGNAYLSNRSTQETNSNLDRKEQIKEQWLRDLNEQRIQQAKMKEEEKKKQREEELMFEEKFKAQMRELNRDILNDVQINSAPKKEERAYIDSFSQRNQPRTIESDEFSTREYYPNNDSRDYAYDNTETQHRYANGNNNQSKPVLTERSNQVYEESYNAKFNEKVETLKQELVAGRKLFTQQIRDASSKMGIDPHQIFMSGDDRNDEFGSQKHRNFKHKHDNSIYAGPEQLRFYDGRTGALAERTINLEEMKNNVNTKFVMDTNEYLHGLANSGHTNENSEVSHPNRENNPAPSNYKGAFDTDANGMKTTDLEVLGREISKYTTLLNENHYNPAVYPFMGRMDTDDFKKLQEARQEQIEKQQKLKREKETKELAEPSKYFEKIDEMLKDFRKEFK